MDHESFPSFPFFARDWIAATATLSAEQKGMFIDLLAYAWEQTPACMLPDDDAVLAKLAGVTPQKWKASGPAVRRKFDVIDGKLRNSRQWKIYSELLEHRERRRKAGRKGNEKRWKEVSQSDSHSDGNAIAMRSPPLPLPSVKELSVESSSVVTGSPPGASTRVGDIPGGVLSVVPGGRRV